MVKKQANPELLQFGDETWPRTHRAHQVAWSRSAGLRAKALRSEFEKAVDM
jgi:hypothetical protein